MISSLDDNSTYVWKVYANYTDGTRSDASAVWTVTTDDSLVQYWDFASEGGTRSMSGSGAETVSGVLATGLQTALSIEARVRVRSAALSFTPAAIVSGGGSAGWRLQLTNVSGRIQGLVTTNDPGDTQVVTTLGFQTDRFNHIVGTYDQAESSKKIYMNSLFGDDTTDEAAATGEINVLSSDVTIGGDPNATLSQFNGFIDEIAIYDRALTSTEVTNNYCALEALAETTLPNVCR